MSDVEVPVQTKIRRRIQKVDCFNKDRKVQEILDLIRETNEIDKDWIEKKLREKRRAKENVPGHEFDDQRFRHKIGQKITILEEVLKELIKEEM